MQQKFLLNWRQIFHQFLIKNLFFTFILITNLNCFIAFPQCNLGLKLFSVERGNALCASFVPFECVGLCEWVETDGGGCNLSSHYSAFRGLRTYMSGFVLNDQSFLVQCCATLATTVNLGKENSPVCRWSEQIETVIDKPTIRLNFPLEENEYFRDLKGSRLGNGAAKIQTEICQFSVQRNNCDRKKMSEEENHKYSLLLLRLQRARDFFQNRKGVKMLNSGSSDNKEEIIEEINRISIKNSTKNDEENKKEDLERIMQLRDDKSKKEERNSRFLVDGAVIGKIKQKFNNKINEGNRTEKQNNGSLFYSKPKLLNNDNVNINILLRKIHRLRNLNNRKTTSTPRLVPFPVKKRQQNGQRVVPVRMQINNRQRGIRKRIKIPLKYTNSTKEIIPPIQNNLNWADIDEFFTDSITSSTTDNSPFNQQKSKQTNLKEELNWQRRGPNRRELGIKKLRKSGDNAGNLLEEEINEQFLENKEKEHNGMLNIASSSGGGSFAQETFENTGTHQNGVSLLQMPFTQKENIDTSPLVRAPKFNVVPLINNPQIKKSGPRRDGWVHIEGVSEIVDNSRLNGLLECCQEQSFGCRPLCTRNVSKEQIKQAMSTGRCPPLSLTNVIQCFPRFYNITSVGQCCASSILLNNNLPAINSFMQIKREIPPQCLSLCSSNFHLTIAHFACIEYVEHILGCYRQLLEKENGWNLNKEWGENVELQSFQHK